MSLPMERMSRVDTAWLRMDTPENLMMIVGIWVLEPRISLAQLRERCTQALLPYRRFRQYVAEDVMGAHWVEDPDFDIAHHVEHGEIQRRAGQSHEEALREHVGALTAEPLDPRRPLWHMALVEDHDGRSVLISRIHHCIADGIALIAVMLAITDGGKPPPARKPRPAVLESADSDADWWVDVLLKPITDLTTQAIKLTSKGMGKSMEALVAPENAMDGPLHMARLGLQAMSDITAFALMPDDSPTRLKGKPGMRKTVAWDNQLGLAEVKAVGKAMGASVNDVLLACVAGAIGSYLAAKGDRPDGQEIRAMVPVNLRAMDKVHQLGNRFGLVPLVLPVGVANPVERLFAVRKRMQELKGSFQPVMAFGLLSVAGLLIKPVQHQLLNLFAKKATAVMTNVPGPAEPLKFLGSTVKQVMFWVPQSGDIGMGVSILTYAGKVQFGLITDAKLCPDPEAIVSRLKDEFEKLETLVLMLPWGEEQLAGV